MSDWRHISGLLTDYLASIEQLSFSGAAANSAVRTGFADLDNLLLGLKGGELFVIASRPSVGKSSLALNIAWNAAVHQKKTVAIYSLELAPDRVFDRLVSAEAGISVARLASEGLSQRDLMKVTAARALLTACTLFAYDSTHLTVDDLETTALSLQSECGLDLIVVDWLQMMRRGVAFESRWEDVGYVSRGLKRLSRELNVPLIACSQVSRAPEQRRRIPDLTDLAESGSIEGEADVVILLHREDQYVTREQWERDHAGDLTHREYPLGITQLIVAKHRNGPKGTIHLSFRENIGRFQDLLFRDA